MSIVRSAIDIGFPYTHSTGPVVGRALAAFAAARILGARCSRCGRVVVPARDWCDRCGGTTGELLDVGPAGTVSTAARAHEASPRAPLTAPFSWLLVRLDGADTDLLHVAREDVQPGARVRAVWRPVRTGAITDIERFEPGDAPPQESIPLPDPVPIFERRLSLPYTLSAGAVLSRFFTDIAEQRAIHGVRCTACATVLVPPQVVCARCWADTEDWVRVADRGIVTTFVIVNVPFHGQTMALPYVLARILLDGAGTSFLHVLDEIEPAAVRMGLRVEAVWSEQRTGFLADDIAYFRPTGEPDAPVASFIACL